MTFRVTLRRCFVLLLCLCLCLGLAVPALAEDAAGSEIRLLQTEGTVNVSSTSGKSYSTREDMRLYNGYVVSTEEASYAWITLDSDKAVKLDQCSSLEVRRSGKNLELLLKSGELFFNVTAPLKEDEKLNIRTSTMVTGVRGTAGWIKLLESGVSQVGILEGRVVCRVANPFTGASRTLVVKAGQIGEFRVYEADSEGEGADARLLGIGSADEISGFILEELLKDPDLVRKILEDAGLDFSDLTPEQVAEKLEAEQEEVKEKLKEIMAQMLEEVISKDPLWEGDQGGGGSGAYTITWNIMGSTDTTYCKDGEVPAHAIPEFAGYVFSGWYPTPSAANGNATYTAIYTPVSGGEEPGQPEPPAQYTVTWIVDGERTETTYSEGTVPSFENPVKNGYRFTGWDPPIQTVTGDAEYTAVFTEIDPTEYTVTWLNEDGSLLLEETVEAGVRPNFTGEPPTKEGYRFVGWDPEVTEADGDAIYTAVFEALDPDAETGTVTWIINETDEPEVEVYALGATPSHEAPTMEPSTDLIYVFTGWYDGSTVYGPEEELPAVTGDTTYTAEFSSQPRSYTVTWVIEGEDPEEESYEFGTRPSHAAPEREPTVDTVYTFTGWSDGTETYSEVLPAVTGDVTYTAQINSETRKYTVTWIAGDSEIQEEIAYGETPVYGGDTPVKAEDDNTRYTFSGEWEPQIAAVTGDAEYTAKFTETPIYAVTLDPPKGVTLATSVSTAAEDESVPLTVTVKDGYELNEIIVTYETDSGTDTFRVEETDGAYSFTMPAAAVTVSADVRVLTYAITTETEPDGVDAGLWVNVDNEDAVPTDETVSFEVNWPSDSYVLDSVTVSWSGGTITPGQSGNDEIEDDFITRTYTFDMPAGDATVKAVFREYVELYVGEPLVGVADVKVNGDEASMNDLYFYPLSGSEVTLTIQPHAGYRIANDGDGVSIYYGDHNAYVTMAGENTYTFTMPDEPASLEVNMEEGNYIDIQYADYGGTDDTGIVTAMLGSEVTSRAFEGDTVVLDVQLAAGYAVSSIWYSVGNNSTEIVPVGGVYSFVMPNTEGVDIVVLVTFTSAP